MLCLLASLSVVSSLTCKGSGPPLFFSTGLSNSMPRFLYTDLRSNLETDFTVFTGGSDLTSMDEIADEIGAETVALVTHSSFRPSLLLSERVERAVLCDPALFPDPETSLKKGSLVSQTIEVPCPCLVLKTDSAYDGFIPPSFDPSLLSNKRGDDVVFRRVEAGHADLLDERWSFLASKIDTLRKKEELSSFSTWDGVQKESTTPFSFAAGFLFGGGEKRRRKERNAYRKEVVSQIRSFLLGEDEETDVVTVSSEEK